MPPFRRSTQYNRLRRSWALFVTAMLVLAGVPRKSASMYPITCDALHVRIGPEADPGVLDAEAKLAEIGVKGVGRP